MTDPVKYLVTVTEHALLVELRVPIPVPDLTQFALEHRFRLNKVFDDIARWVETERDLLLKDCGYAG